MEAELKRKEGDGFICVGLEGRILLLHMQQREQCCHREYSSMAACSLQRRLYNNVSQAQNYLCSQLSSEKWSGTSTKTLGHSSK